jgi:adenosylcobinamide-GDP ribazoletransferase
VALSDVPGGLRGAVAFLTRIPIRTGEADWNRFRALPAAFPLVAYLVGAIASIPLLVGGSLGFPETTAAFGYLLALVVLVGIPHLDGVADLGDAAAAHGGDARRRALKDTETGVGAIVAVAVVVVGLVSAALGLAATPRLAALGLVVAAEVGAKLGMATVACLGSASREGLGSAFTRESEPALLVGPLVASLPAALFPASLPASVAAVAAGPLVAVALLWWADRTLGGVNGDVFGATNELGRVLGLHVGVIVWTLS